jgi:alpha-mannosidase
MVGVLFRIAIGAREQRVVRFERADAAAEPVAPAVFRAPRRIGLLDGPVVALGGDPALTLGGLRLMLPELHLVPDPTDTWSHGIDRYAEPPEAFAKWQAPKLIEQGPLRAALMQTGRIGDSRLLAEWRVAAEEAHVELVLRVNWRERHKLLRLMLPLPAEIEQRVDGIAGGELTRAADGAERPLRDRVWLDLRGGQRVGVVCPDTYAAAAEGSLLSLTLLRSPMLAHHDPQPNALPRSRYADQGEHEFRFRFFADPQLTGALLDEQAAMMHRPPVVATLTTGMPNRAGQPKW